MTATRSWRGERLPRLRHAALWTLLIAALGMRFVFLTDMEFKGDEYALTVLAYRNVFGETWLRASDLSSVGIPNPPFFIYLLSLPVLLSPSPVVLTLWIGILNAAGLLGLFLLLKKLVSPLYALEATALMASVPWGIVFSRKIWSPDALFPFMILALFLAVLLLQRYKAWMCVAAGVMLALVMQLHMSAWFLPLPFALFVIGNRPRLSRRTMWPLLVGLLVAILLWSPYLLLLSQDGFASLRHAFVSRGAGTVTGENILWAFSLSGTQRFSYLLGSGMAEFSRSPVVALSGGISAVYQGVTVLGFLLLLGRLAVRTRGFFRIDRVEPWEKFLVLLFLVFLVIHGCFFLLRIHAVPHYNIVFYPFFPVLFVFFLRKVVDVRFPVLRWLSTVLITTVIVANLSFSAAFLRFVHRYPALIHGDYGIPYRLSEMEWTEKLSDEIRLLQGR